MKKKLYIVYHVPTAESFYFLDKKKAKKTEAALEKFEREEIGDKYGCFKNVEFSVVDISTKVIKEP